MKINKKLIIIVPIVIAVFVFLGVYLYYYSEDNNSLTVTDKNWIEENITSLVDIEVMSDYPVYGDNSGVFNDFITSFENAADIEFNEISYSKENDATTTGLRFRVISASDELTSNDLLINEDVYIVVSKEKETYDTLSDVSSIKIGVLSSDSGDVSYYMNGSGLTYKSYDDISSLFSALNKGDVDSVVIPHIMYLNYILDSDNTFYINFTISEMSKKIVLTLDDSNSKLNEIVTKYFNSWKDNSFVSVYNTSLFDYYIESKGISDSDTKELEAKTYTYGYVTNYPYEVIDDDELIGICGEYISRINRLSGIDFEFVRYDTVSELLEAVANGEVDIYFNYYDTTNEQYNEVNSTFVEEYVVLARVEDSHIVTSFESLKGQDISMIENTALFNYFKDNSKANINSYSDYKELISKSNDDILVIDKEVYNYYRNSDFKDYEILYTGSITKDYSFMIISGEDDFYDLFSYVVSTNSYYRYRNTALNDLKSSNSIIVANSFEELYIVILVIILIPIIFLVTLYILARRKRVVKKVRKEERRKYTDNLTSLKNRSYLNLNIDIWNKSEKYPQTIVMIDLNNIKYVNDNYGHEAGDKLIIQAAATLVNTQLENSEIIRTDGNEFLIYLVGYSEKQIEVYTKKLNKEFKELPYGFGAGVGYSMITDGMKTIDDAINEATLEMRTNKEDYK